MNDLLKEAIADAKAVRETALANAKIALEEAFTPRLQSMLSAKIREEAEVDDLEEDEMEDEMAVEGNYYEDGGITDEPIDEQDDEELSMEQDDEELAMEQDDEDEVEENLDNTVPAEEAGVVEEDEDDLELEAIIKELEDEIEEDEMEEPEISESNDTSSEIGTADNKEPDASASADDTDDSEGTGVSVVAEVEDESETSDDLTEDDEDDDVLEGDEDIDLEEVIRSLREEEEEDLEESEDGMEGESETINNLTEKLKESYSVVKFLRSKINEVNLLNAKLLFTNKLFRSGNLTEGQKLKIIETFDRARSTREVKLVYTTLAETSISLRGPRVRKAVREGFASKQVGSTRPNRAVLSEGADLAQRFKKLAGLIK